MIAQPMGFGRGRGAKKVAGDLFKNVDTTPGASAVTSQPASNGGFGGSNGLGQSNGGFGGQSNTTSSFGNNNSSSFGGGGGGGGAGGGSESGCRICKEEGHFARECPSKGEEKCFRCQQSGHRIADCDQPDTRELDPDRPAPVTYVPSHDDGEDALFSSTRLQQGINFAKYKNIPIEVTGPDENCFVKATTFAELNLGNQLLTNITRSGYNEPTPIQSYALPIIIKGKDVMACAQTGSGKTAAFVLPMINVINTQGISSSEFSQRQTPDAIVITPTRELAIQIYRETCKFSHSTMVKAQLAYGGASVQHQRNNIRRGCNILIGTPGRLKMFVNDGTIGLDNIKFFVLDEADRMLDMGFQDDINFFASNGMPPKETRQTLLFSATFAEEVQTVAKQFLKTDYLFVRVGTVGAAQTDVTQLVEEVEYPQKTNRLKDLLREISQTQKCKTLIFVKTKKQADFLATLLSQEDFGATSIHGDRQQREREEALRDFRTGSHPVMVATSVAARGLDIVGVTHVINYDMPDDIDEYVHRIGRTGRAGNTGTSISFFAPDRDADLARDLVKILSNAQQDVPDWLDGYAGGAGAAGTGWNTRGGSGGFGGSDVRNDKSNYGHGNNDSGWNDNAGPASEELW